MAIAPTERPSGFWSYVHRDDAVARGRILRLAERVREEFETLTAEQLQLFIDRTSLAWGDKWRSNLNDAITESTFFIAIITPHFFKSDECRNEFLQFVRNAKARGVLDLVLPILWVHDDGINEDSADEVRKAVAGIQWIDCTALRLADEDGVEYLEKVNELATRLIGIVNSIAERPEAPALDPADSTPAAGPTAPNDDSDQGGANSGKPAAPLDDDTDGILDLSANLASLFPEWTPTLERYQSLMQELGSVTDEYTSLMQKANHKSPGAKLVVARNYAKALDPIAEEFQVIGIKYADQAMSAHNNIMGILRYLYELSPEERSGAGGAEFVESIRELAQNGQDAVNSIDGFQASSRDVAKMSKDVRRPLAKINQALQSFTDGHRLFEDWLIQIDEFEAASDEGPVVD